MHPEGSAKLAKVDEFLTVADTALSCDYFDAAVSLSVSAAINASDILCLEILGRYSTGQGHDEVFSLLRKCGTAGMSVSRHLQKILKLKGKAQYSSTRCRQKEAEEAYKQASRALDAVKAWLKQNNR